MALGIATVFMASARTFAADKSASAPPPAPPLPVIQSLRLEPASLTLKAGRDERRVLVFGVVEGGKTVDLTAQATFKVEGDCVEAGAQGYLRPKAKGEATVIVKAEGTGVIQNRLNNLT